MRFSVSYDATTKVLTVAVGVLMAGVTMWTGQWFVTAIGVVIMLGAYGWSPRGYEARDGSIAVARWVGDAKVRLDRVREVRRAVSDDFNGCIRLFGNGGVFGYYGIFRTSKLGKSTWYLTNRDEVVVVVTEEKTALFSPDDVDGFLEAVRAQAQMAEGREPIRFETRGGGGALAIVGVVIGGIALTAVVMALTYSPGPPRFTLTRSGMTIHDRFYPVTVNAADVDVSGVRVVDFGVEPEWRPVARTNGFANSHYASGWFRAANGRKVRMYRAGARRVVLLPPHGDGVPVLMETTDAGKVVEQVKSAWGK